METSLLQAPSKGATSIGTVPQFAEIRALEESGDFYYAEVLSTGQEGWILKGITTVIKPDIYKPVIKIFSKEKRGNVIEVSGVVADDTEVKGVYANGAPIVNLKKIPFSRRLKTKLNLPFKPEDVREFSYSVFIPEGYPSYEVSFQAVDREEKTGMTRLSVSGGMVLVKEEGSFVPAVAYKTKVQKGVPRLVLSVNLSDENRNNVFEGRGR